MIHVNNDIYKDIANVIGKLMSENGFYWSDIINNENCDNSFFSKEDDNDFDLQLLIKYIEEYSFENSTEKD